MTLSTMQGVGRLDAGVDGAMLSTLAAADEPLDLLFEAYAEMEPSS